MHARQRGRPGTTIGVVMLVREHERVPPALIAANAAPLLIAGAVVEFAGILTLAWPDVVPFREPIAAALLAFHRRFVAPVERTLRRLLRRPKHASVHVGENAMAFGDRVTAFRSVAEDAPLERKLAFLIDREREAREAVTALTDRVATLEAALPKAIEDVRTETAAHAEASIRAASHEYLPLRLAGAAMVAAGLILATLGNFVGESRPAPDRAPSSTRSAPIG